MSSRELSALVAPLDWGLGHATRCIPIIRKLIDRRVEVVLAADRRPYELLAQEFPSLELIRFPGFEIDYPGDSSMAAAMAAQLPKIVGGVIAERRRLAELITRRRFDLIISDNRFGLQHLRATSIYITHQLTIRLPVSLRMFEAGLRSFQRGVMRRFDEIWIPDYAMEPSLGGELSHPPSIPRRAYYIGPLTRFARSELCPPICRKIIAIISGPEPQRSMFENLVVSQLTGSPLSGLILLGKSEERSRREIREGVEVVSHLDAAELQYEIERSEVVVSRPGYSTLMDLASLRKPAVFVATPGQTEQEYLASRLSHQPGCVVQSQEEFDLGSAVSQLNSGDSPLPESGASVSLDDRLDYWLNRAAV